MLSVFSWDHLIPKILPILFRRPDLVVGIPVALEILRLAFVIPRALFQLKVSPGILNFDFAIMLSLLDAFVTRLQPHANGGGEGDFPVSAAVAVRIVMIFFAVLGDIGGLLGLGLL